LIDGVSSPVLAQGRCGDVRNRGLLTQINTHTSIFKFFNKVLDF